MTVFQDSDHFGSLWWQSFKTDITSAVFDGSAFLKRTLRGRFREKLIKIKKIYNIKYITYVFVFEILKINI